MIKHPGASGQGMEDVALIWGHHSVREALRSQRRVVLRLQATAAAAARLASEIAARGLEPEIVDAQTIAARAPFGAPHQGLLLEARPLESMAIDEAPADGLVLVLDQVTDPHNFGAIVRTAAAFGVDAIVTTERHSPALSGVVAKSASGGLEHVPICEVVNLARALETLDDMGYMRIGLDSDAPSRLEEASLARPLALVLGAEGQGLRRLTREKLLAPRASRSARPDPQPQRVKCLRGRADDHAFAASGSVAARAPGRSAKRIRAIDDARRARWRRRRADFDYFWHDAAQRPIPDIVGGIKVGRWRGVAISVRLSVAGVWRGITKTADEISQSPVAPQRSTPWRLRPRSLVHDGWRERRSAWRRGDPRKWRDRYDMRRQSWRREWGTCRSRSGGGAERARQQGDGANGSRQNHEEAPFEAASPT